MPKFYVTTSIPYANAKPHMGHPLDVVYADVLARYYRDKGNDVFFLAGLDENGAKIDAIAHKNKITPQEWVDRITPKFLDFHQKLNTSYDYFIRTSDKKIHWPVVQEIWARAKHKGDIYKKKYAGLYCVGCEDFKKKGDLVNGVCPDHLTKPEWIEEENYFFRWNKYQKFLIDHLEKNPDFIYPCERYNEMLSFLKSGLEDISISRPQKRLSWGVPVPDDPDHVMYVWFDALICYLSGVGFLHDPKKFEKYWPANLHIVGKDNNKWHSLLWPAMLKSADLSIPKKVLVHAFILGKGGIKMSKTIGNIIDPIEVIKKYGTDAFRYFLLSQIPMANDGVFSLKRFDEVYEADLANDLGNLLQRVLTMINNYKIKVKEQKVVIDCSEINKATEELRFSDALEQIWELIIDSNKYIEFEKPWELAKNNPEKLERVLNNLLVRLRVIAKVLGPYLPETSEKIKKQLKTLKPEPLFPKIN